MPASQDGAVGFVGGRLQRTPDRARRRLHAGLGEPAAEAGVQQRNGHAARHFAAVVAAHAVGQQGQPQGGVDMHGVFVVGAHPADSVSAANSQVRGGRVENRERRHSP